MQKPKTFYDTLEFVIECWKLTKNSKLRLKNTSKIF